MTRQVLKTVGEVIDALGGPTVVGDRFDIGQAAVSMWKIRKEIPPGWHLRVYLSIRRLGKDVHPGVFGLDSLDGLDPSPLPGARRRLQAARSNAA